MTPKNKILILGGTEFVGRQLVQALLKDKTNDLYLFNRGKTNPNLFPTAKRIIGDRETKDIEQIKQHQWDYIIDFSSYFPKSLKETLLHINKDVKKYIYISTISVYAFQDYDATFKIGEDFKKKDYEAAQLTEPSLKYYGEKKSACEDILNDTTWLNSIILRPSVIYGKFDPTHRLYYWIDRIKSKEKLLVPAKGEHKISLTYSVDLVNTILACLKEQVANGTYNCVSDQPTKFIDILGLMKDILQSTATFELTESKPLKAEDLSAADFPFWFGANIMIDNSKLIAASKLVFTPFKASIAATIKHYETEGWPTPKTGISYEAEDGLIEKFRKA